MRNLFSISVLVLWTLGAVAQSVTIRPSGITPAIGGTYPRLAYDALVTLPNPQRGDLAYDLTFNCLRVYNGSKWVCTFQSPTDSTPNLAAIAQGGGIDWDKGYGIVIDGSGNVYVTGYFTGTATFGTTNLISAGGLDIFVAKYNGSGALQWVQKAGGTSDDIGYGIAVDGSGNVYVTGSFSGTATFGTTNLTSTGGLDDFVAKYNGSGVLQWVQKAGGTSDDIGYGIAVDGSGNVYVTGSFQYTATFGATSLTSAGRSEIFVAKYYSSGTLQWVQKAGGASDESGYGIAVIGSNTVYVTGDFSGTATFGTTNLTSAGFNDIFVAKYNGSGTLQWVQKAGGTIYDKGQGIAIDGRGNVYVTGFFQGTASFGTTSLTSEGRNDIFVAKYNSGGTLEWAQKAGGTGGGTSNNGGVGYGIAVDGSGNVYVTGSFGGIATFGNTTLTSAGSSDVFITKYDESGALQWVQKAGSRGPDVGQNIAVDRSGNVYITGSFIGEITFGTTTLTALGGWGDIFVARIDG